MHEGDLIWMIGGPQGGGINVSAEVFARAAARAGQHVFANIEYHSNIMGEHSYYKVRVSPEGRHSLKDGVHVLVALDEESLLGEPHPDFTAFGGHLRELVPGGVAIYDSGSRFKPEKSYRDDVKLLGVPFMETLRQALKEFGREADANRLRVMTNTVAIGASVFAIGGDIEAIAATLKDDLRDRARRLAR